MRVINIKMINGFGGARGAEFEEGRSSPVVTREYGGSTAAVEESWGAMDEVSTGSCDLGTGQREVATVRRGRWI